MISGSVEISPGLGLSDAIFDIVSTGGTLKSNGLKPFADVMSSEAILIGNKTLEQPRPGAWRIDRQEYNLYYGLRKPNMWY